MTKLAISVLVPCYNGAKYINRCFDSILGQNYDQELIKIIVINDGSTDNSLEILKQYQALHPTRIKIIDQENKGLAVTRNLLVDSVDTEFFIFSDVDDYYLPNAFMHIVNASQNGKSDIVTSRTYRIGINGKKKIWWLSYFVKKHMQPIQYINSNMIWVWNTLYKTSFFRSTGFRWKKDCNLFEDTSMGHFVYPLAKHFSCCKKFTYCFTENYNSMSNAQRLCKTNDFDFLQQVIKQFDWFIYTYKTSSKKNGNEDVFEAVINNVVYLYAMYLAGMFYVVPHRFYLPFRRKLSFKKEKNWRKAALLFVASLNKHGIELKKPTCWWKRISYFLETKHRFNPYIKLLSFEK